MTRLEPGDVAYPALLAVVPSPPSLWLRGAVTDDDALAIGIVGSRLATPYGRAVAERLAADLAARGVTVVSGLARGIDAAAHRGALAAGGRTLAVLGSGLDVVYPPEHRRLADEIERRGALLSQFPPGTPPLPHHFPIRNRVLAGLVLGVVVVEAGERSGALITAGLAGDLGREVFAVPGPITAETSRGANALIQDGAKLVQHWSDIVQELPERHARAVLGARVGPARELPFGPGSDERRVFELLSHDAPQDIERVIARCGMAPGRVAAVLIALELEGWARQLAGQRWIAAGLA